MRVCSEGPLTLRDVCIVSYDERRQRSVWSSKARSNFRRVVRRWCALQVTRAIGDLYLKDASFNCLPLPPLVQVKEPYKPPYIYNEPEVRTCRRACLTRGVMAMAHPKLAHKKAVLLNLHLG